MFFRTDLFESEAFHRPPGAQAFHKMRQAMLDTSEQRRQPWEACFRKRLVVVFLLLCVQVEKSSAGLASWEVTRQGKQRKAGLSFIKVLPSVMSYLLAQFGLPACPLQSVVWENQRGSENVFRLGPPAAACFKRLLERLNEH